MSDDPAILLHEHANFRWREGMKDRRGRRIVDLDLHDGASPPDLLDAATAGVFLGWLAELGALSDVVREGDDWIVAIHRSGGLQGYAADSMGEAAGWALLMLWDDEMNVTAEA